MAKLKRKLRGMEVAQTVLLLVIAVAIALALWFVISGMMNSANAPQMQYDPSASYVAGGTLYLAIKTGITINKVGNATLVLPGGSTAPCTLQSTLPANPGQDMVFTCSSNSGFGPGDYVLTFTYNNGQQAAIKFYWAGG